MTPPARRGRVLDEGTTARLRYACGSMMLAGAFLSAVRLRPPWPCPFRMLTGRPCPFCGLTTSVLAAMRMHPKRALAANPAGLPLLGFAAYLVARKPTRLRLPAWYVSSTVVALLWLFQLRRSAPKDVVSSSSRRQGRSR